MVPSPRMMIVALAGLAVAALPAIYVPQLWLAVVVLWAVLGAGALVDVLVLWLARPEVSAEVPATVGVGADVRIPVQLTTRALPRLHAVLRPEVTGGPDDEDDGLAGESAEQRGASDVEEAPLQATRDANARTRRGTVQVDAPFEAPRRGGAVLRAIWTRLDGPLRLFRRIDRHPIDEPVAVVPNVERVRQLALAHFGHQPHGGVHVTRKRGDGGELDSLEAYEPGMDLRKVDWKSSARHQHLQVRRFRIEQNQRLILCTDTGRLMADPIAGVERLDHAIHAMLLLSRVALKNGDLVGVHAYGERPRAWVPPAGGMRQMARLKHGLATLDARPEETNHVLGLHKLVSQLKRRSLVVVFTEFGDATTAELMVEYLGHLARRHLVIFVALDDPAIEEPFERVPSEPADLAAATIAGGMRQDRQRVLRRLSRMGIDVISGPPGPAALSLLARYVHVKRRGLIG